MGNGLPLMAVFLVLAGCSQAPGRKSFVPAERTAQVQGTDYATLTFQRGGTSLDELDKRELNELAMKAARSGLEIEEIHVLAWPDKEYQAEQKRPNDVDLK